MLHSPFDRQLNSQGKTILAFKCNKNGRYLLPNPVIVLTLCYCTGSAHGSGSDGADGMDIWHGLNLCRLLVGGFFQWPVLLKRECIASQLAYPNLRKNGEAHCCETSLTSEPFVQAHVGLLQFGSKNPLECLTLCCACLLKMHLEYLARKLGVAPNSCWKLLVSITANRNKALLTWAKSDLSLPYTEHACKKTVPDSADDFHVMPFWCSVPEISKGISCC